MERLITVADIKKCRKTHQTEFSARFWKFYFRFAINCMHFQGPKEQCLRATVLAVVFNGMISLLLFTAIIENRIYLGAVCTLMMLMIAMPATLSFVAYKRCEKFTIWGENMTIILDHLMLGRPLLAIRFEDGRNSNDPGTLRLLKSLRAYILDDQENVETELLKDVEFLFHCIWGTEDTAPLTVNLEYTVGYFDRCGSPQFCRRGIICVEGELLDDIVYYQCVISSGIAANTVENDLWISDGNAQYKKNTAVIVGDCYSRFKLSSPKIMLILKINNLRSTVPNTLTSTALKSLKNTIDDENPCCICYNASDSCIICAHCHRPVICEDCADEMMKLRNEQGFNCPNCR